MLYKSGGQHEIHGGKFDYTIVEESEVDQAIKEGWYLTTDEAKKADKPKPAKKPTKKKVEEPKAEKPSE
jgi:hypothetical protein